MLHSEMAERQLLGHLLYNPCDFPQFDLTPASFYYEGNRMVWKVMKSLWEMHQDFNPYSIIAAFEAQGDETDWHYRLNQIMQEHAWTHEPQTFATLIRDTYQRRCVLSLCQDLSKLAQTTDNDNLVSAVMNKVNEHLKVLDSRYRPAGIDIQEAADQLLADFYDPNPTDGNLKTGIPGYDKALGGGYEVGHHGILASSGTGKTILLSNLTYEFAKQGANVMYVLMESNAQFLMRRLVARYMRINPDYLRRREVPPTHDPDDFRLALAEAVTDIGTRLNINILVTTLHVDTWRQTLSTEIRRWGKEPDVLIIDYGQKVAFSSGQSPLEAHTIFGNELTEYSVNEQKYVFTALQVRKEGNAGLQRAPGANDIRGTSNWFNVLDTLASLYREPLESHGEQVGYADEGFIAFPKLRDTDMAAPVPVVLIAEGLLFGELAR